MPLAASIEFPMADVDALFRQMDRAQRSIGMSMGQAVRTAATAVAASIGASTRVAPKHRDFRETGQWSGNRKFDEKRGRFFVNREFEVTSLQGGVRKDFRIWAKDKSAAKRDKRVIIGRRGLAKMAWRSAAASAGLALRGIGTQGASGSARRKGDQLSYGRGVYRGDNPEAHLVSRVEYAAAALQGGPQAVETAFARAARNMERQITDKAVKKLGAK